MYFNISWVSFNVKTWELAIGCSKSVLDIFVKLISPKLFKLIENLSGKSFEFSLKLINKSSINVELSSFKNRINSGFYFKKTYYNIQ